MNFKKTSLIFLIIIIFSLMIGTIYASEDINLDTSSETKVGSELINNPDRTILNKDNAIQTIETPKSKDTTSTVDKSSKQTKKISTNVKANQVAHQYKKSQYFKIKVEKKYDDDIKIKNTKLKLKVFTGPKYKTYTVNTDKYGIAKFNTKNLKIGTHKIVISSADDKYKIYKKSKIFIGKQYSTILKDKSKKVLNTKDVVGLKFKTDNDDNEKEVKVIYKKAPKHIKITKAKFYLKNKKTGKIITFTDKSEFDDGRWDLPDKDYSSRYTLVKVKVSYIKI